MVSSSTVTSVAVPTCAAMEKKESSPAGEASRSGSTTSVGRRRPRLGAGVAGQLLGELDQPRVGGAVDAPGELLEQVAAPLAEVDDPRSEAAWVQGEPQHVDRRLEQRRVDTVQQCA